MTDVVDAEYHESTAIAVRDELTPAAPAMFGTTDPVEIVERAVRVADALKKLVVAKKLVANIKGKEYPLVEAWQTMGAMLGLTCVTEWSRRVPGGWEARAYVVNSVGRTIGSAESQCLKSEYGKDRWEDYAIRSMAQTRAVSKAFRSVLAFVMVLAGYQATPAEEMPPTDAPPPAETLSPTDLRVNRARELELIGPGTRQQGLIDLKNYLHELGVAWGLRSIDAHFDEVVAARLDAAPEEKYADKKPTAQQKKLYFALCGELKMDEKARHAFNAIVTDKESFSHFTFADAHRAIDELNRRIDVQNAGA